MSHILETAPSQILIEAFTDILEDPFLLEPNEASAVWDVINNLPDDVNAIALTLKAWCQEQPEILEILKDKLSSRRRGPAEEVPAAKPEDYKTLLKNKMRQSFPEITEKKSGAKQ
ncbi:MAG: hypothetical protein KME57_21145 [Scytonema hyalinum WJT4-NPBG1]|jgi:D-ribose pyranose/furanose isomerase RbsD|nr:hypothetical protein [Scytonema hyalinum WJT4-NPBG1]